MSWIRWWWTARWSSPPTLSPLSPPFLPVVFSDPVRYRKVKELFIAAEGLYTGQFIYAGRRAALTIGNTLPVGEMPEGTIICAVEEKGSVSRRMGKRPRAGNASITEGCTSRGWCYYACQCEVMMKLESAKDVCHELATNPRTCPKMSHMRASVANF